MDPTGTKLTHGMTLTTPCNVNYATVVVFGQRLRCGISETCSELRKLSNTVDCGGRMKPLDTVVKKPLCTSFLSVVSGSSQRPSIHLNSQDLAGLQLLINPALVRASACHLFKVKA